MTSEPHRVEVRLYADLASLASGPEQLVPLGAPRSVKDLIESLGVPHPEVGVILVDGEPVGFDHLVDRPVRVAVFPPFANLDLDGVTTVTPPRPEPRFVADVHLGTLARRLRLLGFDTWYRTDADDDLLAAVAIDEGRVLLTRDRGLLMRRVIVHGYCPRADDPDLQLLEVAARYDLGRHSAPFTRCPTCNGVLDEVTKAEVYDRLPPRTRIDHDRFARCRDCEQVYWPGSHTDAVAPVIAAAQDPYARGNAPRT
jgi:uncharacterized protein